MPHDVHRDVGRPGFGDLLVNSTVLTDPTYHAEQAAAAADSASCELSSFTLPDFVKITDDGRCFAGWTDTTAPDETVAAASDADKIVTSGEVFEATVADDGSLVKVGIRVSYTVGHDLCVVVTPDEGVIITAWANRTEDTHGSLDESGYVPVADVV